MTLSLRLALLAAIVLYFFLLFLLLKKERLILKYSLLWLLSGLLMLLAILFPQPFLRLLSHFGIADAINGLLATAIFLCILIIMSLTSIVSRQSDRNRRIVQELSLLEERLRSLEGAGRRAPGARESGA